MRSTDALIAIRRILRAAEFSSRELARRSGLTPSQVLVLQIISAMGEAGAGAISETSRLSQATVTALLDRLEERQLVVRRRELNDRRRVTVELTQTGREALNNTPDFLQDRFAARFERLARWEQASLVAALERIAMMLDAEGMDASPVLDIGSLDRAAATPGTDDN